MPFSSVAFLFFFLPMVLALYSVVPSRLKNAFLLIASLLFYVWGGGASVFIFLASMAASYFSGLVLAAAGAGTRRRHLGLLLGIAPNIGLLVYFKYANFLVGQLNALGHSLGIGTIAWNSVALPIGISFFVFHSMSYTIDVYRGRTQALRNPTDFALYVSLFPQLIAGPIVRYHQIAEQLRSRHTRLDDLAEGVVRFSHGLVKKVVIADSAAVLANAAFGETGQLTTASAWVGLLAYTIQIYFDFSGYSDMAIGIGRALGFVLPENFRRPYSAISITDFWRRWHISLSSWFRDYVYVPLGGNRAGPLRTYRNLAVVFFLTGLWHGANWTFVVWGCYHGCLLIIERVSGQRPTEKAPAEPVRRLLVLLLVMVGWVFFRSGTLQEAFSYLAVLFSPHGAHLSASLQAALSTKVVLLTALGGASFLLPRSFVAGIVLSTRAGAFPAAARAAVMLIALPYAAAAVAGGSFSPFLYFQF